VPLQGAPENFLSGEVMFVDGIKGRGQVTVLSQGDWKALVDSYGGQVLGLFYQGKNILHYDAEDISHSGIPLCVPNFGPLVNGEFLSAGKAYKMGQHGFIRDRLLTVCAISENAVSYRFVADQISKQKYPFDFEFTVTYSISDLGLKISLNVDNLSCEELPLAPGVHPYFSVENPLEVCFETDALTANNNLNNYAIETLADSEYVESVTDKSGRYRVLKNPEIHLIGHSAGSIKLYPEADIPISIYFDNAVFNRLIIWRKSSDAKYICVEPAYVKNGLNDQPLIISAQGNWQTELLIAV
jgi:galactose mutarotase-like enzyme|tara:strand:+ start:382 stop:1278 length:897 start_codon:yes stop_codon:yes gene_type:complete